MRKLFTFLFIYLLSIQADARVFSFDKEGFATYLRATGGTSHLKKTVFESSGPSDIGYNNEINYNFTGELGVQFALSKSTVRLGLEIFRPWPVTGVEASDSSGSTLYTSDFSMIGYGPTINFEFSFYKGKTSRTYWNLGLGYQITTIKSDIRFTNAGTSSYGLSDYTEEGVAYNFLVQGGLGFEFLFTDVSTLSFDLGYRSFTANNFKHTRSADTLLGSVNSGDVMKDSNGSDRSFNLSGPYLGLTLRFYIR